MKDLSVKSQLDLENNKILNGTTDTPTLPESIVNKEYVDNAVANVHPIFIGSGIFDLALGTDYSVTTFINTFYEDTTHTINNLKTDLDKIFAGCPVTISEIKNASSKVDNELSSPNVYLKVNKDYFLGYRDFKLTWIDPLDKGKLKYLYLTFPQQSSGNINYLVSDEYSLIPNSYEKNSDIIPTSTASSKKISDRLNNINIVGDVYKGQSYYDNTNNQLSISTYRRNAVVGIEMDKSKPWFKFASFTSNKRAFLDSQISFHVSTGYGDRTKIIGILTAHFRTGTDYKWESGELTWSLCGDTIDPTHFVLAHNDQDPCVVELWCKCVYLWGGYHFDVIAENARTSTVERTWKLTQSWNKDGQTEITKGYTQIVSSYIQLKPNFNDRGFIKLKPNSDTDFSFNSSNLNLNSTEYLKVGTFRADTDAIAQSLTNCPTKCGFVMYVNDPLNLNIDNETTATHVYRLREIRDWQGNIYYQAASSSNTAGTFTYSNWINITAGGSNINSKVDKSDLGLTTFKVTRTASTSSNGYGYWAAMLNSSQTGSPVLPSTNKWWHVLSMDWSGTTNNNTSWVSQLALPTNDGGVPHYRRNTTNNTAIDSSTWHKFITDENIADQTVSKATSATSATKATQDSDGNTINTTYLKLSGGTMTGTINTALRGTHLNGNDGVNVVINSTATAAQYQTLYRKKSNAGVFTLNGWDSNMLLAYTADSVISAGTNSISCGLQFYQDGSLRPWSSNAQSLGASDKKWSNVYATTFTGNLSGNASTATKLQTARKINTVSFDGSADITITANPTQNPLSLNADLNTIKTYGEYYCSVKNTITNKPTGVDSFGLKVFKTSDAYLRQELSPNLPGTLVKYNRVWNGSAWSKWELQATDEVTIDSKTPTKDTIELWVDTSEEGIATSSILDSLTSTSTTNALSANQGKILNDKKLNLTGGTLTGNLTIQKQTNATVSYTDTQNPRINFLNANGSQAVSLIFTDHDTYKAPYGLTLIGNGQSTDNYGAYLKVEGCVYAKKIYGTLVTDINTSTHLQGNKGTHAIINSTINDSYQTLYRKKSKNGVFTINGWNDNMLLAYTADSVITNNENKITNGIKYLENGSLIPFTNNTNSLGNSSSKWSTVYSNTFNGKLECINGRLSDANIAHTYENAKAHVQLLQSTDAMTKNKPAGDGFILHFSWDTSGQYNQQLYVPAGEKYSIQTRGCNNGTWGTWENLYRAKELYSNASGTSGTVTLNETAANFSKIDIYFSKGGAYFNITSLYSPNNSGASLITGYMGTATSGQLQIPTIFINGTTITKTNTGGINFTDQAVLRVFNGNEIFIHKVVGYR